MFVVMVQIMNLFLTKQVFCTTTKLYKMLLILAKNLELIWVVQKFTIHYSKYLTLLKIENRS